MLGHLVDQQGVRPNLEKVRAVQDFHDRKAVTLKSLLPLKAMEFVLATGILIEKSKLQILQPT